MFLLMKKLLTKTTSTIIYLPIKIQRWHLNINNRIKFSQQKFYNKCKCLSNQQLSNIDIEKNSDDLTSSGKHNKKLSANSSSYITTTQAKLTTAWSKKSVFFRTSVALVSSIVVIIALVSISLVWYYMGWIYGLNAILVAVVAVIGASGVWHWFGPWLFVAAVTAPRDIK